MVKEEVGIISLGKYVPSYFITSDDISKKSGVPKEIIEEKLGIKQIAKAKENEHLSQMALEAIENTLGCFDPSKLDIIIYCGSGYKDYFIWPLATKIQHEIGAYNAFAFEINAFCVGGILALQMAKDMMLQQKLNYALIVTAARESDLIDYSNKQMSFMFNFGDGAAACLLKRGDNNNKLLSTSVITDGSFSDNIKVKGGGSKCPASQDTVKDKLHFFQVDDFETMK